MTELYERLKRVESLADLLLQGDELLRVRAAIVTARSHLDGLVQAFDGFCQVESALRSMASQAFGALRADMIVNGIGDPCEVQGNDSVGDGTSGELSSEPQAPAPALPNVRSELAPSGSGELRDGSPEELEELFCECFQHAATLKELYAVGAEIKLHFDAGRLKESSRDLLTANYEARLHALGAQRA